MTTDKEKLIYYSMRPYWLTAKIEAVEVDRVTDKMVQLNGKRVARYSSHQAFFPSWEEAHAELMRLAQEKVDRTRNELEKHKSTLGNIKGMKP